MHYIFIFIILLAVEILYIYAAKRLNIVDIPNYRSSHEQVTVLGGGLIFWFGAVLYFLFSHSLNDLWFIAGISLVTYISFRDDRQGVAQKYRLMFHLAAMTLTFCFVGVIGVYSWWMVGIGYILFIGILNAYNFMDGINGITGLNTVVVLLSLMYVNMYVHPFVENDFILIPLLATLVFLFFNFRKKALVFAGDVGSISIAFWIVTLLLLLIIKTENLVWIGFLTIYGIDSVSTIAHRLYLRQNIMEPHRLHFYQILANEQKMDHRLVSMLYFIAQLICSAFIIFLFPTMGWWIIAIIVILFLAIYSLKFRLMKDK